MSDQALQGVGTKVDHNAIKFTQVTIIVTCVAAWLADLPGLIAILGLLLVVSVAWPERSLLRALYRRAAVPLGLVRPHVVPDDPAPHRFSQGMGAAFLLGAAGALYGGLPGAGWVLTALVAALAAVNVLWNFCAGCFIFHQLRGAGLLGRQRA